MFQPGKGKTAGIISPSISLSGKKDFSKGLSYLEQAGYKLVCGQVLENALFDESAEKQRAKDIMDMFSNPDVDIIFCASGGAGSQRLLSYLDFDIIRKNPKILVGHSDNTALQLGIYAKTQNPYISGFSLDYDFRALPVSTMVRQSFEDAVSGKKQLLPGGKTMRPGMAEGILLGDCLSMVCDLCGTRYFPDIANKILVLEDECEKPYKIDRLLTTLRQHQDFNKIAGIVFGKFTECDTPDSSYGSVEEVLFRFAKSAPFPIIYDFPFGHIKDKYALKMGKKFKLNANACQLEELPD